MLSNKCRKVNRQLLVNDGKTTHSQICCFAEVKIVNQRVMLTKRLIKESLLEILKSKKIQQVSVKELCMGAEINRSTFYEYYGSPRDVLIEIEQDLIAEISESIPKGGNLTPQERLLTLCEVLYAHIELEKVLFRNNSDEDIEKMFGSAEFSLLKPEQFFNGESLIGSEDREYLSEFINHGMYHILRRWLITDSAKSPNEIAALINRIFLYSV